MLNWFNGKKTLIAGIGGIFTALGYIVAAITTTPVDTGKIIEAVIGLLSSLAVLGVGGKIQKLTDLIRSINEDDPTTSKDNPVVEK